MKNKEKVVLLVHTDNFLLSFWTDYLTVVIKPSINQSLKILCAKSGKEGIAHFQQHLDKIDIIVTGMNRSSQMNGIEMLEIIDQEIAKMDTPKKVPVLIYTGNPPENASGEDQSFIFIQVLSIEHSLNYERIKEHIHKLCS